jgi:hypothetical protein
MTQQSFGHSRDGCAAGSHPQISEWPKSGGNSKNGSNLWVDANEQNEQALCSSSDETLDVDLRHSHLHGIPNDLSHQKVISFPSIH